MSAFERRLRMPACLVLLLFLGACVSVKWGTPIPNDALGKLKIGESTHADILLALGQPRGEGVALAREEPVPRELLFYEYLTGDSKTANLEILLVFVANGKYDGHIWFAATERIKSEGSKKAEAGAFPDPAPLEDKFRCGKTTREEALEILGPPAGTGGAMFPPEHRKAEVLYYEHLRIDNTEQSGDTMTYEVQQQIMGVMFVDGVFDAFIWYSTPDAVKASGR